MSFLCPKCTDPEKSLSSLQIIELPSDARSDEITLQVVKCSKCDFSGIAVYEESRRGALDDDSFSHTGYSIAREDLEKIKRLISSCPDPGNARCDCPAHLELGKKDASASWIGIKQITKHDQFTMEI